MTALQAGDLRKLQGDPRSSRDVFRYPFPGTWYLLPQATKAPFDNLKVRKAVAHAIDRENVVKVSQGLAIPAHSMIPPGFPGAVDDPKIKAIQKYDKKAALDMLKGTPFEGGKNWPRITLSMRDEGLGSKPLAGVRPSLDSLNMKTELEVLGPRVFRERPGSRTPVRLDPRFMDYPDPHNGYLTPSGKRPPEATAGQRRLRQGARAGRDTPPEKQLGTTKRPRRSCSPTSATSRWPGGADQAVGSGPGEQGRRVRRGRQYLRGHAPAPLHHREGLARPLTTSPSGPTAGSSRLAPASSGSSAVLGPRGWGGRSPVVLPSSLLVNRARAAILRPWPLTLDAPHARAVPGLALSDEELTALPSSDRSRDGGGPSLGRCTTSSACQYRLF